MKCSSKLVQVTWEDANSPAEDVWYSTDDLDAHLVRVESVGWIVKENRRLITLAGSKAEHAAASLITIPRKGIKKIRKLKR